MFYQRNFKAPESISFFLFGPRGTGKTTWLKQKYPNALWIDLLTPSEERLFSMNPELLKERLDAQPGQTHVIIDEIQKVPKILDVVHGLIEEKKQVQFILTGSSSRKIKQVGTNLLAGRALWKNFHPFLGCELKGQLPSSKEEGLGEIPSPMSTRLSI